MVSSILYYCYYALCYGYEQVVLYCDCYAQTCFLSFSQCSLSSGIVLLCISICTLYRLLPVASFWLLYYCVGFAVSLRDSCVLFSDCAHGHARYQDIMRRDQLWLGNVCFVTFWLNTSSSMFCNHDWRSICCRHGRDRANVVYD